MGDERHYGLARLRRGFMHFAAGKPVSAILGFSTFVLTATLLPVREYGAYVTFISVLDLAVAISFFGLDWVAVRFVPEYRISGSSQQTYSLLRMLLILRFTALLICALVGLAILHNALPFLKLAPWEVPAKLYLVLLVSEGMGRFARDHLLDSLLRQGASQLSSLARGITMVSALSYVSIRGSAVTLETVVVIEIVGSVAGLIVALVALQKEYAFEGNETCGTGWHPPRFDIVWRLALNSYVSMLIALLYGPQMLMLIASRMLGLERAAIFGFARNLAEQVKRYLPSSLFVGLVRPVVIARFSETRDFGQLNLHSSLIFKLSIFALAPVIVFFVVFGSVLVELISGAKFINSVDYIVALILVLIPFCHRQVLEMVINTLHLSRIWTFAALCSLVTVPVGLIGVLLGFGIWGLIFAVMAGEIIGNVAMVVGLWRNGYLYRTDYTGQFKILLAVGVAIVLLGIHEWPMFPLLKVISGAAASLLCFLAVAWVVKPFQLEERSLVNRLLPWPFFNW